MIVKIIPTSQIQKMAKIITMITITKKTITTTIIQEMLQKMMICVKNNIGIILFTAIAITITTGVNVTIRVTRLITTKTELWRKTYWRLTLV